MEAALHEDCWWKFSQNGVVESRKKFTWQAHVNFLANALAKTEEMRSAKLLDADILNQTTPCARGLTALVAPRLLPRFPKNTIQIPDACK